MKTLYAAYEHHEENLTEIRFEEFAVTKETPKGFWILVYGKKKFVLADPNGKRLAYNTHDAALSGLEYRKRRQLTILKARIKSATRTLETATKMRLGKIYTNTNTYPEYF